MARILNKEGTGEKGEEEYYRLKFYLFLYCYFVSLPLYCSTLTILPFLTIFIKGG
jgi:hypothetical protein